MKTSSILLLSILLISIFTSSCTKHTDSTPSSPCAGSVPNIYSKSINIFDLTFGSPYYNQVIANFKFTQTQNTCPSLTSSTSLVIQNNTKNTISLDYNINFSLNLIQWNSQGVATIPPFSSFDAGVINSNPGRIDLGAMLIQCASITYR